MTDSDATGVLRRWIKLMFSQNIDYLAASFHEALEPVNNIETANTEEEEVDSINYHFVDQSFDEEFYKNLKSGKFWLFFEVRFSFIRRRVHLTQ